MANRIITAATIIALLTPLAACGTTGGGLASAPEHRVTATATAANVPEYSIETSDVPITSDTFVFTTSSYPFSQARFASGQWESKASLFDHAEY